MASPNIGQTGAVSFETKDTSGQSIKSITVLPDGAENSIFSMLFVVTENGEKKINEQ
jgi:hypothetical protein